MSYAILVIGLLILLCYAIQVAIYLKALYKDDPIDVAPDRNPLVTLLVPFRNEETNLNSLLGSINRQNYPADKIELILINDHSEDQSLEVISNWTEKMKCTVRVLSLEGQYGKKHAIDTAVFEAKGDWIIQTDADCSPGSDFILAHARAGMQEDVKLVAGPVALRRRKGIFARFEALDFLSMQAVTMASFKCGRPAMCNGSSLSFSRDLYTDVREELLVIPSPSGDDMFLLSMTKKRGQKISYLYNRKAIVWCSPSEDMSQFLKQRIRWGSKAKHYSDPDQVRLSLLVWLANTSVFMFLLAALFNDFFFLPFVISWFVKALLEFHLVMKASYFFRQHYLLSSFFLAAVFYYIYISITGMFAMFSKITWKGREY